MEPKKKNKSFIIKLFSKIAFLLIGITLIIGVGIYQYAYTVMIGEVTAFNQASLEQVANVIGDTVMNSVYFTERIAYSNQLIDTLKSGQHEGEEELQNIIEPIVKEIIKDSIWLKSEQQRKLFDIYITTEQRVAYRSDNLKDEIKFKNYFNQEIENDILILDTVKEPEAQGIYQHVFQIHKSIRDHLTGETVGYVILNITEKVLYDSYAQFIDPMRNYIIVNEEGEVISAKDKRKVTMNYKSQRMDQVHSLERGGLGFTEEENEYSILSSRIPGTEWYLIEELDLANTMKPLKNMKVYLFINFFLLIIVCLYVLKEASMELVKPINNIKNQMEKVTQGNLDAYIEDIRLDEFGQISYSFNKMLSQINELLEEVKRIEQKKRLAELDFLRAQINPHFIYNTLSSIRFFIEMEKNKEAEEMLFYFSKVLRATLSSRDQFINIKDEIETIKNYVGLQKLRYSGSFEVIYDIEQEIMERTIPNFILQPIIENSIFYSIQKEKEICTIYMIGRLKQDCVELRIVDNGIGMSKEKVEEIFNKENQMNSIGIRNVHERLQLNYGEEYGLEIISDEGVGVQVIFKLPR